MVSKVIYVATREPSYSRVAIVGDGLRRNFDVLPIVVSSSNYAVRITAVVAKLLWAKLAGRFRGIDAVFVGFLAQPIVPVVRLLWRGPLISDAYLSLYDTVVLDKQRTRPGSWLASLCQWLDQYMLRHSDLCLTDTNQHADYLRDNFDVPNSSVARLWVSATDRLIRQPRLSVHEEEEFRVFFWGNYIPLQGVDTIVRAAHELAADNIELTLTGRGQTYTKCRELITHLRVTNIRLVDWMEPAEIHRHAAETHVVLGIFGTSEKAGRVIPNKVFQGLAMGVPIITRDSDAIRELLADDLDAFLVPPGDPAALANKIRWVRDHYERATEVGRHGHATFMSLASPDHVAKLIADQLSRLGLTPRTAVASTDVGKDVGFATTASK